MKQRGVAKHYFPFIMPGVGVIWIVSRVPTYPGEHRKGIKKPYRIPTLPLYMIIVIGSSNPSD